MCSIRTRVHARIPNGHLREEKRASDKSPRKVGELNGPRAEVGEEVRVGVGVGVRVRVGPVEFKLKHTVLHRSR